jgi:hypothetical protein
VLAAAASADAEGARREKGICLDWGIGRVVAASETVPSRERGGKGRKKKVRARAEAVRWMASARSDLVCVLALPARACDEMRVARADGEGGGKRKTDDRNGGEDADEVESERGAGFCSAFSWTRASPASLGGHVFSLPVGLLAPLQQGDPSSSQSATASVLGFCIGWF